MPDRLLPALLVAATCWSLPTSGNAQGPAMPGRSRPIAPMTTGAGPYATGVAPGIPVAVPAYPGAVAPGFAEAPMAAADPNRRLQAGDQLLVKIEQDREGATPLAVSSTGEVTLDPIPHPIRIVGMSLGQATSEIKRLLEKDYYYTATVRLSLEKASNPQAGQIQISGSVNRVGPQPLFSDRPLKLSQAIVNQGGFGPWADDRKVRVTRMSKDGTAKRIIVDVKSVLQEGKVENDILLQDTDQIFVPERNFR